MFRCLGHLIEDILNSVLQHGDSIILLHGALVKSNLTDSNSQSLDFDDLSDY